MFKLIKTSHFIILIFAFYSCEYELSRENFLNIKPPSDNHTIELNLIPDDDTIKIFKNVQLTYDINTGGLENFEVVFSLQGKTWFLSSDKSSFMIDVFDFIPGFDTLKLVIYLKTGTGSIADHLGLEGYYFEKKWIVLLDKRPAPVLIATKSITKDGVLKIKWFKCEQYNFNSYEIEGYSNSRSIRKTIWDADSTFFIDSLYVGGEYNIRVSCRVEDGFTWGQFLAFNEPPPQLNVEEMGFDSLRVSWNKSPYNAKYRLMFKYDNLYYFNSSEDTVCTIAQIGFGNFTKFELCTRSQKHEGWPDLSYTCDLSSYKDYYLGERLIAANRSEYEYNVSDKVLYSNSYNVMKCFDINNYTVLNSVSVANLLSEGLYSCQTNSSKIATISFDNIYVFENKNLVDPITILYREYGAYSVDHFLLTNNNLIAYAVNKVYRLIDINSKQTIASIDIGYSNANPWALISTSQDGKYMCAKEHYRFIIYNLST